MSDPSTVIEIYLYFALSFWNRYKKKFINILVFMGFYATKRQTPPLINVHIIRERTVLKVPDSNSSILIHINCKIDSSFFIKEITIPSGIKLI